MIKDVKLTLKLIKYSPQYKTMKGFIILFAICGILFELFSDQNGGLGGLYIMMTPLYVAQLITFNEISSYYKSAPGTKSRATRGIAVINTIFSLLMMTIFVLLRILRTKLSFGALGKSQEMNFNENLSIIIVIALGSVLLDVYNVFIYKKYVATLIIFLVIFIPLTVCGYGLFDKPWIGVNLNLSLPFVLCVSYALILLGGVVFFLLTCLTYKLPLDKHSYRNIMRHSGK